jgi:hypothetical protein
VRTVTLDNYDSFTFNLYQYLGELEGRAPLVLRNDDVTLDGLERLNPGRIVISPYMGRTAFVRERLRGILAAYSAREPWCFSSLIVRLRRPAGLEPPSQPPPPRHPDRRGLPCLPALR